MFIPHDALLSQFTYPSLISSAFNAVAILKNMRICHLLIRPITVNDF